MPLPFVISAALAAALGSTPAALPASEVVASEVASAPSTEVVDGVEDRYQRMTVPVTIDGQGPFRFMIDTGSQATVVTRGLSDKLQLRPVGVATVVGMASRVPVQLVALDGLEFAERVFDNISAPMLEARHVGADGILGLDSLQDMRVLIDFRSDTIAVDQASELGGNRGYEIVVRARRKLGRLIITDAVIDGIRTAVIIDTGAQNSVGNMALSRKLRANKTEMVSATDVNGETMTGAQDIARMLKIQGMQINNVPITFTDSPAFDVLDLTNKPSLILGMGNLRLFDRVAIDFASRTVLFDLPVEAGFQNGIRKKFRPSRI